MGSLHQRSAQGDGWRTAKGRDAASRHGSLSSRALMLHNGVPSDMELAVPVPTSLEIRDQVNSFLAALPLGVTRRDAELEDCIAAHLHDLLNARSDVQLKLNQWVRVALGLQEVVERQHAELARLHETHRAQRAHPHHNFPQHQQRALPDLARPDQAADGLGLALAAQHAELAQMRAQMASLRQDLLAAARRSAGPGDAAAAAAPSEAQGATQGALEEQLRVRTAEVQSAREEATRLRTALVDAELELQRVTSREPAKRRSEQDRARLAAEALAAQHRAASLQECARRQAAEITQLRSQLGKAEAAAGKAEGMPQDEVGQLTAERQALIEEVQKLQEHLKTAAAEREAALSNALAERQALKSAADAQQAQQAELLRAERAQKEALTQEFEAFRETAQARQESLIRQLAADNAAADEARSLRQELDLERRHCSLLEGTLTEARSARSGLEAELTSARSRLEDFMAVLEREREELASLKIAAEAADEREKERRATLEQALEEERERRAAEAGQLRQRLAELACQVEEARGLAAERADVIDDLTARLATEDASWQAHHRAAILDLQAAHSEELERLQAEHALEVAGVEAAAEADREHGAAVAAALRCARFAPDADSAAASDDEGSCPNDASEASDQAAASHGNSGEETGIGNLRGRSNAAVDLREPSHKGLKVTPGMDDQEAATDGPVSADSVAADAAKHSVSKQAEKSFGNGRAKYEVSQGRLLLAMLAAAALTSARPRRPSLTRGVKDRDRDSPADTVCRVTLGGLDRPQNELAARGNSISHADEPAPDQDADTGSCHAPAWTSVSANGAADGESALPETMRACGELVAEHAGEREHIAAAVAEVENRHGAEMTAVRQQCAAEVAAAEQKLGAAVRELRERLSKEHTAAVAALQSQHESELAALRASLCDRHQQEMDSLQRMHEEDLGEVVEQVASEKTAELRDLQGKHESAMASLQERLSGEHAEVMAGTERQQREEKDRLIEEAALSHTAELLALRESLSSCHEAELAGVREQHEIARAEVRDDIVNMIAAMQRQHKTSLADLESQHEMEVEGVRQQHGIALAELKADLDSRNEANLAALREEHESSLADLESRHEAKLAALKEQHTSTLIGAQAAMQSRHEAEAAALRAEQESALIDVKAGLQASHVADLAAQKEQHESVVAEVTAHMQGQHQAELASIQQELEKRHDAELAGLMTQQFEAGVLLNARHSAELRGAEERLCAHHDAELAETWERLLTAQREAAAAAQLPAPPAPSADPAMDVASLPQMTDDGEGHSSQLERMSAEHAAALAKLQEDLTAQHSREMQVLAAEHAAATAQLQEKLTEEHSRVIDSMSAKHGAALKELIDEHSRAVDSIGAEHSAAIMQLQEKLSEEHRRVIDSMAAEHSAAIRQLQEELSEEHNRAVERISAEHAAAEHAAAMAQLQEELSEEHNRAVERISAEHAAAMAQLQEELSEEHNRVELQAALMDDEVASVRAERDERVNWYKAKLKEANEALQAAQAAKQQQEQPGKQQQPDEHEEFVLAKRNSHAGTPLNRGWQTERKPSLRHAMAQLEADNHDLLARCRAAEAAAAADARAADALRRENLELAAELAEAGKAGHAAADATRDLREQLAAALRSSAAAPDQAITSQHQSPPELASGSPLQIRQPSPAQPDLAFETPRQIRRSCAVQPDLASESPRLFGHAEPAQPDLAFESLSPIRQPGQAQPDLATPETPKNDAQEDAGGLDVPEMVRSGSPDLSRLQAAKPAPLEVLMGDQAKTGQTHGGDESKMPTLEEAVQELTERCEALEAENLHLQDQVGGALGEELHELQGACLSLRRSNQDLAAQLAAAAGGHAAGPVAPAEDNAALRKELAELETQLAALAAEANRLQDENLDLSVAVAAHRCDTAKLEEMAEVLEERDAIEADLRARIADLYALDRARSSAEAGSSEVPKLIAAQLRIELLEAQLREAAANEQAHNENQAVCSRCGETLHVSAESSRERSPDQAVGAGAPDLDTESNERGKLFSSGAEGAAVAGEGALSEAQAAAHAAELASMQEAFLARTGALEEDLQYKEGLLQQQQEALEAAEEELASRQEALLECQDMVAELQAFSEAQQAQLHSLQQDLQAAQGRAEDSRAAAAEAEEQLCEQQQRAEEAARQLAEAKQELTMREDTLQELTLENQRLQLELSETRGRLQASRVASAETCGRVESLAARLAAAHNTKPVGMIWENPQARIAGNSLSATGSASIVKALQGAPPSQEVVVRAPSRPASPAATSSADVSVGNGDISHTEVQAHASSAAAGDRCHLAADAADCSPLLAGYADEAAGNASDWDSDQENDGKPLETYSLGVTDRRRRAATRTLRDGEPLAADAHADGASSQLSGVPDSCTPLKPPFASLHHNALYGEAGSSGSPDTGWAWRSQVAETPTPLRSCDNPVRESGSSPLRGSSQSSPLRTRRSAWAEITMRTSTGSPLRTKNALRDSGGSPLRTRDLPRRSRSGPVTGDSDGSVSSRVVAVQRSLFTSPPPALPSPPDGIRDIAGRWHGTTPPQWARPD